MKLNYSESSLVIIGGWNPSIINPVWISNYLIEPTPFDNQSINISIGVDNAASIKDASASASFDGIRIILTGNRLEFHLETGNDFALLEKYALKMFRLLPNTLVSGYGANFHFQDEKISQTIANIIDTKIFDDLNSQLISKNSQLISKQGNIMFNLDDMTMSISAHINTAANTSGVGFNFHFNIGRLSELESRLSKYSLSSLKDRSIQILSDVYGLKIEV